MTPEQLARLFHEIYERLAPKYKYETRKESAVLWQDVPEQNKKLMIETCRRVLTAIQLQPKEQQMENEKYTIFKTQNFDKFMADIAVKGLLRQPLSTMLNELLEDGKVADAWVTRAQDSFAPVVGHSYANAVQNALDILTVITTKDGTQDCTEEDALQMRSLEKIRDAAFEFATLADAAQRKLPS